MLAVFMLVAVIGCGSDGDDGSNGTNGIDGVNGTDGADGSDGADGADGQDGADGTDGQDGYSLPKHVILFIGDGMHEEHEAAASRYFYGIKDGLIWKDSSVFPYSNYVTTWDVSTYNNYANDAGSASYTASSYDSSVGYDILKAGASSMVKDKYFLDSSEGASATDSASAGTAISTGYKTDSGNIAWKTGDPAGGELETIGEYYRTKGGSYGIVSTVEISHATPACFASHNVNRGNYTQIFEEISTVTKPDVVIGAGHPSYNGEGYITNAQLAAVASDTDYTFVERTTGVDGGDALLAAAAAAVTNGTGLFGIFGADQVATPVVTDTPEAPTFANANEDDPLLSESTEAAITVLSQDTDGFFLMIEQGDIDWSNHSNDYSGMVGGVIDLHYAVAKAEEMVDNGVNGMGWDNTLIIVTSDHGNSYLRFNTALEPGMGDLPLQQTFSGTCESEYCGSFVYPEGEVFYGTGGHTNELVSVYAKGADASYFETLAGSHYTGTDLIDNTDIYKVSKHAVDQGYNVIIFIGDGMQKAHEIAGSRYLTGEDSSLSFHNFDYAGNATTWDVNTYNSYAAVKGELNYTAASLIDTVDFTIGYNPAVAGSLPYPLIDDYWKKYATDSASAGTALSSGVKTDDGNICWISGDPDDGMLLNIADKVRDMRRGATGIVSTVEFTHATPAAFASHNVNRNNYTQIGEEIINSTRPDVVIGAGHPAFVGSYNYISETSYNTVKSDSEYVFVERTVGVDGGAALTAAAAQAAAGGKKLFGLFGATQIATPVVTDNPGAPAFEKAEVEDPSLAESTSAALTVLSQDRDGFFLMVEQGDIDWSNHANNYSGMVGGVIDLEYAVKEAIDFVNKPGDLIDWSNTLLIVTSDHGNSFLRTNTALAPGLGELPLQEAFTGTCDTEYCGSFIYPNGEVFYGTGGHTNEYVSVYAKGYAANDLFAKYEGAMYPGIAATIIDNTHIFKVMAEFLDVTIDQ
jgi:alkaline phosphatase